VLGALTMTLRTALMELRGLAADFFSHTEHQGDSPMAPRKKSASSRRTSKSASKDVESAMRRRKRGTLKSGSGKKVTSKKQAIAIGLSEARKKGKKVARKKS
jgi:hypothetical protein